MKTKLFPIIIIAILLLANGSVSAQKIEIGPDGYGRGELSNGIKILYNLDKNTALTGIRILFGGSLVTETADNNGISNLAVSMLLKGNDRMNAAQIAERLDFLECK